MAEKHLTDGTTALAAQPRVIKIEAAEKPENARLRVAAYTRVSSDSDDQLNSFAAQNRYYAELISGKAEWRMVDRPAVFPSGLPAWGNCRMSHAPGRCPHPPTAWCRWPGYPAVPRSR